MSVASRPEEDRSLEMALAELDEPVQLEPLPRINPAARLYASTFAHRALPAPLGLGLTHLRANAFWRMSAGGRSAAIRSMEYLLGRSERAGEATSLARVHTVETARRSEYLWRPWLTRNLPVVGLDVFRQLKSEGRGSVMNFMHHGPYVGISGSLRASGGPQLYAPIAPFFFETPPPGFRSHRDRRHLLCLQDGARVFSAAGSREIISALLQRGDVVPISTDIHGRMEMEFLGRRVLAASGAAKTAMAAQVPVVPVSMKRGKRGLATMHIQEPIEPGSVADAQAMQQEIARRHEPAVLEWPEALEWPMDRWLPADEADAEYFGFSG